MKYLLSILLISFFPISAFAKDISFQSGFISAILKIEPSEIVAREPSLLYLEFKDNSQLFSFKRCDCYIKITSANGKEIINKKLEQNEQYIEDRVKEIPFTFGETGVYTITIGGQSVNKVFPTFTMSEKLEISLKHKTEGEKRFENFKKTLLNLVIPLAIILIIAGISSRFLIKNK